MENPFIDNKYTNWYYQIIKSASKREHCTYTEVHHIVPVCFYVNNRSKGLRPGWIDGNPNLANNLVRLTPREHFVCHWLLTKMVRNKSAQIKMEHALSAFGRSLSQNARSLTSLEHHRLKLAYILSHKGRIRKPSPLKGKKQPGPPKRWWNDGHQELKSLEQPGPDWLTGRLPSPLAGRSNASKGRRWWTNGMIQVMQVSSPGSDWKAGKLFRRYSEGKLGRKGKTYQPHSQETKAKISAANTGRKRSRDTREKMSNDRKGKPTKTKDTKYWTNDIVEIRRKENPGDGWRLGRLKI